MKYLIFLPIALLSFGVAFETCTPDHEVSDQVGNLSLVPAQLCYKGDDGKCSCYQS